MGLRREGAAYVSYVTISPVAVDAQTAVERSQAIIDRAVIDGRLVVPTGSHLRWTGTYERAVAARKRLLLVIPAVLVINLVLVYLHFRRIGLTLLIFTDIPVSLAGGFLMLSWWPGLHNLLYRMGILERGFEGEAMYLTVAVWVGFIALFGITMDDGIVIGTYLEQLFKRSPVTSPQDIEERVVEAGLRRIRPCLMTAATTLVAMLPILLSTGRGADLAVPMAVPLFGGMLAQLVSLWVVPAGYCAIEQWRWRRQASV
jgi:Cu(I)/Ag(I) efflux system membrane protein CusA/SilA